MKMFLSSDLKALIDHPVGTCVSLYMPMHLSGGDVQQDPIRLKNLVSQAEKSLVAAGHKPAAAKQLLAPAHELLASDLFWRQHCSGLALFVAPEFFKYYRLPVKVEELVLVNDRFHVKPLVKLVSNDGRYFVLALSMNKVRLLDATQYSVREIILTDAPDNLEDSLPESVHERQLLFHSEGPRAGGNQGSVYYGAGPGSEDNKDNLTRYFRQIDKVMSNYKKGRRVPMVLAGVDYLLPLYREVNSHFPLLDQGVVGNPDTLSAEQLRDKAWQVVEPYFSKGRETAARTYRDLDNGSRATNEVAQAVIAAMQGKVDTLFVPSGGQQWGRVDTATGSVEMHPVRQAHDIDLLDFATVQTLTKNGAVYVVEPGQVPGGGPIAAIYRF